jgi:anti-sigma regulatory factor (Ser/Thr protein kinase)
MRRERISELSPGWDVKVALVEDAFHHEALLYSGEDGFLRGTLPFIAEALACEEPLMIAVGDARRALLEEALGDDAERVLFVNMRLLGRNPARIIPAWREFVSEHAPDDRPVRGIGEPVWPGRSEAELDECARHESLLNVAFAGGPAWRLLCPYDLETLAPAAIAAARLTHPSLAHDGISRRNDAYRSPDRSPGPFAGSLPAPAHEPEELAFTANGLAALRMLVYKQAAAAGVEQEPSEDFVLAVNELATNSVQHGGGGGTLAIWTEPGALVAEVRDRGHIDDPLVGRRSPPLDQHGGRGLWLVNHLCDLVQTRSTPNGTVVRVRMRLPEHDGRAAARTPLARST